MIPKECKRLAEVDFPIAEVSKHSAREKSIRHGHPSTLHLWWARRPLAACRAMLLELLLPDPCDENCPKDFKKKARDFLPRLIGKVGPKDEDLRKSLLKFIADFANWDNSSHPTYLEVGRGLVKAAHGEETPLVVDPFAGGGSIPLEALRLDCDAFASDLNPVACLILKVMLEDIPRHGPELAEELRRVGKEIKEKAEKELGEFYPKDPDGATPIAYLWARTVRCEEPDCGANIPLVRTGWLAVRKSKRLGYTKLVSLDLSGDSGTKRISATILKHKVPTRSLPKGDCATINNGRATCLCCNRTMSGPRVKEQLSRQNGGSDFDGHWDLNNADGAALLAVISRRDDGLIYRLPTERDIRALDAARQRAERVTEDFPGQSRFPTEPINPTRPSPNARGVSGATRIGITDFGRLFTQRQKVAIRTIIDLTSEANATPEASRALLLAATKLRNVSRTLRQLGV